MNRAFLTAAECLKRIYSDGAYCEIALNESLPSCPNKDKALCTCIVYGVLDNYLKIDYIIDSFTKTVKPVDRIFLHIGIFCLLGLSIPDYCVINDCAELTKTSGNIHTVGFVNATLRAINQAIKADKIIYPTKKDEYLSVFHSFPLWATRKLIKQYGYDTAKGILSFSLGGRAHIRINLKKITVEKFRSLAQDNGVLCFDSPLPDCLFVKGRLNGIESYYYTNMSLGSCYIARALDAKGDCSVLDLCAAPGGKAVYIASLNPAAHLTACDLYEHRLKLTDAYARRMSVKLKTVISDATQFNGDFAERFDYCLCDVPCSNFGVFYSKPDVKRNRQPIDMPDIEKTQREILNNAANYLKKGGILLYSTCSLLDEENGKVISDFLSQHPNFEYAPVTLPNIGETAEKQFIPPVDGVEGFFFARMRRIG